MAAAKIGSQGTAAGSTQGRYMGPVWVSLGCQRKFMYNGEMPAALVDSTQRLEAWLLVLLLNFLCGGHG